MIFDHEQFMKLAISQARCAAGIDEVPVGAIVVDDEGRLIAEAHNKTITQCDPIAHAEILALRSAAKRIKNYRLLGTTLYVTVEPCVMCMGAIVHARLARVVFGAPDPKWGAIGSLYDFSKDGRFNHRPDIISGVCMDECRQLMRNFFANKR